MKSRALIISHTVLRLCMALCFKSQKRGHNNARRGESDIRIIIHNIYTYYCYLAQTISPVSDKACVWCMCVYLYILLRFVIIYTIYVLYLYVIPKLYRVIHLND